MQRICMLEEVMSRFIDGICATDSVPAHIGHVFHYRGCSRNRPLEIVPDEGEILFVPRRGINGGVIERCPECGAKGEL